MELTPKDSLDTIVPDLDLNDSLTDAMEEDTPLNSTSTMDELMSALDFLEGRADDSIQASRTSELYWMQALNERDKLIHANNTSIEDLSRLNDRLNKENGLLKQELIKLDKSEIVSALQEDAGDSRKMSLQSELAELQEDVVSKLKNHNSQLQHRLVSAGESYGEIFAKLRRERLRQGADISKICDDVKTEGRQSRSEEEQRRLREQLEELCEIYDNIIRGACDECEEFLQTIDSMEERSMRASSASPRKSRPGSSLDTEKYYTDLLQSSERSNQELRQRIDQLNLELNAKEQKMFGDTMSRLENGNREDMEKLKSQISELSRELSLLNVDNRALRERLLKTETENEVLAKRMKESSSASDEVISLQSNLDNQLSINTSSESRIKELELIRMEHTTLCERVKADLFDASEKVVEYEVEIKELREKLREAKGLQQKFDHMNFHLNNRMEWLQGENSVLMDEVSKVQREVGAAQQISTEENQHQSKLIETIKKQEESQARHDLEVRELTSKLEATEQQKHNANMKVKALRDRLKNMQDSWQKISADTETSFTALREQYQQQIKEYKSIIASLKSQNTSLNARIESLKKVTAQTNTSNNGQVNNLEQQISEYQQITDGYREENILLRKELRGIVLGLQEEEKEQGFKSRFTQRDEFARLRDILTTAKSECESLTLHKTPRSRTSTAERETSFADITNKSFTSRQGSAVKDLKDRYERLSPDYSTQKSAAITAKPPRTPEKPKQDRPWNRYRVLNDVPRPAEPLANSTPRASKSADALHYQPRHPESTRLSSSAERLTNYRTSSYGLSKLSVPEEKSGHQSFTRTKYDSPGNLKPSHMRESTTPTKSANDIKRPVTVITPPNSKTKEVVELKHRSSAELDPSKIFKPINPDNDNTTSNHVSSKSSTQHTKSVPYEPISSYKPSFLSPDYRAPYSSSAYKSSYQPSYQSKSSHSHSKPSYESSQPRAKPTYESSMSTYSRPYQSKHEPSSTYRSKYDPAPSSYKSSYDYKNTSVDSAYGSPSRSYTSKQPSLSSYSSSYRHDPLPSLSSKHHKYSGSGSMSSSRGNDALVKRLDFEISQTAMINRALDDLEHSIDSASTIANSDRRVDDYYSHTSKPSTTNERYDNSLTGSSYTIPYTKVNITPDSVNSPLRHSRPQGVYGKPKTLNFTGSAIVYDTIY